MEGVHLSGRPFVTIPTQVEFSTPAVEAQWATLSENNPGIAISDPHLGKDQTVSSSLT